VKLWHNKYTHHHHIISFIVVLVGVSKSLDFADVEGSSFISGHWDSNEFTSKVAGSDEVVIVSKSGGGASIVQGVVPCISDGYNDSWGVNWSLNGVEVHSHGGNVLGSDQEYSPPWVNFLVGWAAHLGIVSGSPGLTINGVVGSKSGVGSVSNWDNSWWTLSNKLFSEIHFFQLRGVLVWAVWFGFLFFLGFLGGSLFSGSLFSGSLFSGGLGLFGLSGSLVLFSRGLGFFSGGLLSRFFLCRFNFLLKMFSILGGYAS
jgi:hypothetical protein